ncbi:MAG TPA: 16S rRNA (cytosine(1402)-N(4))-methyltransferase RsmH [Phycisphaerales bacterium]|nr:16S rRNA (cytosine(1402)-N(4))-methyltransferase RsmH [Phycisphaerales bacterium]
MRDTDHIPVLLGPVLDVLRPSPPDGSGGSAGVATAGAATPLTFLDATAGLGGHAAAIARHLPAGATVILNDLDAGNLDHAAARVAREAPHAAVLTHRGNFAALPRWLAERGLSADLFMADLGFASSQVDDPARGLSFSRDGPLDMRLDPTARTSAAELIASLPEPDLAQIIFEYGDERHSRAIARAIVEARKRSPLTTTAQFAETVRAALRGKVPPREVTGIDPATKTFQALRIAVNDELGNLHALLDQIEKAARLPLPGGEGPGAGFQRSVQVSTEPLRERRPWLAPRATIAVITFHSLEDRPVKQSFVRLVESGRAEHATPKGKPISGDEAELQANPRARSAKLRAVRLGGPITR